MALQIEGWIAVILSCCWLISTKLAISLTWVMLREIIIKCENSFVVYCWKFSCALSANKVRVKLIELLRWFVVQQKHFIKLIEWFLPFYYREFVKTHSKIFTPNCLKMSIDIRLKGFSIIYWILNLFYVRVTLQSLVSFLPHSICLNIYKRKSLHHHIIKWHYVIT